MTRGKGINPVTGVARSLTIGERQDIVGQRQEAEATLKFVNENPAAVAPGVDKARLKKEIERYDNILHEGTAQKVSGLNKDKLIKEAQRLRDEIKQNMPTREEMDHPAKNPGAVSKHMMWNKRNQKNIEQYKQIQRQIEPDDPTATSVENLRRNK